MKTFFTGLIITMIVAALLGGIVFGIRVAIIKTECTNQRIECEKNRTNEYRELLIRTHEQLPYLLEQSQNEAAKDLLNDIHQTVILNPCEPAEAE